MKDPIFADEQCGDVECGEVTVDGETYQCGTCGSATAYCSLAGKCVDDCAGRVCGLSPTEGFDCGECESSDEYCTEEGQCQAACADRECGTSHNGRNCGSCAGKTEYCTEKGKCVDACKDRDCGLSPYDVDCGECTGTGFCNNGRCEDACDGLQCGEVNVETETFDCGTCTGATETCKANLCVDQCANRECGSSGTVESCGTCSGDREVCKAGKCVDDCGTQQCGESPAGFDCGECPIGHECNNLNHQGICNDVCSGSGWDYECGSAPWHADISCGECEASERCDDHLCVSDCMEGWYCGPTQYKEGGSCGTCDDGLECINRGCSDGTWTDTETGFMWSLPRHETDYSQVAAIQFCDSLELAGFSDWRLPEIDELTTLIRGCVDSQHTGDFSTSTCAIGQDNCLESTCTDNTACGRCDLNHGPGRWGDYAPEGYFASEDKGENINLWSSSPVSDDETRGWTLYLNTVIYYRYLVEDEISVSCVRETKK